MKMENNILINFTGLDGTTSALTGSGDSDSGPKSQRLMSRLLTSAQVDLPEPEPELESIYRRQKLPSPATNCEPQSSTSPQSPIPPTLPVVEKESDTAKEEERESVDSDEGDVPVEMEAVDLRRFLKRRPSSHSYRSLTCPHGDCRRTVSASGFVEHFRYEHRHVARARLSPHHPVDIALSPRCLHPYLPIALCILQVNVSGENEELSIYGPGEGQPSEEKGRGPPDTVTCALLGRVATLDDVEGAEGGVALALWCACLFEPHERPPIAYKLRASLQGRGEAHVESAYRGPVESMRCANSGGLLLPPPRLPDDADPIIALRLRFQRLVPRHTPSPNQ